jgi:hypothetical protein
MIVSWQKSFQSDDKVPRSKAQDVLALSAFSLSSIPAPLSRKAIVKEMWESGAHTIVIVLSHVLAESLLTGYVGDYRS